MYVYRRYKDRRYADRKLLPECIPLVHYGDSVTEKNLKITVQNIVAAVPGDLFTIYEEKQHD